MKLNTGISIFALSLAVSGCGLDHQFSGKSTSLLENGEPSLVVQDPIPTIQDSPTVTQEPGAPGLPSPTPSVTPSPSVTPVPSVTPIPSVTPTPSATPAPSVTPIPMPTGKPTEKPNPVPSAAPSPGADDDSDSCPCKNGKVKICHVPSGNPAREHTICVDLNGAVHGHKVNFSTGAPGGHGGDYPGACKSSKNCASCDDEDNDHDED